MLVSRPLPVQACTPCGVCTAHGLGPPLMPAAAFLVPMASAPARAVRAAMLMMASSRGGQPQADERLVRAGGAEGEREVHAQAPFTLPGRSRSSRWWQRCNRPTSMETV